MDNIVLIGYMGSGKTTVGKYICEKYGYGFVDTDEYIVNNERMSINEIFEKKGEAYFRDLETETIKKLAETLSKTIISTGGGLPVKVENEAYLKALGKVYYLKTDADTIYKRVSEDNSRPLLKGDDLHNKICTMLNAREPRYIACANYVIEIGADTSIQDIADTIVSLQLQSTSQSK